MILKKIKRICQQLLRRVIGLQNNRKIYRNKMKNHKLGRGGLHYDLQAIYDTVKARYFPNEPALNICWFGSSLRQALRYRKLGSYCLSSRTVKVHRLLDQPSFPPYFISYVVYHEVLHSVCPPIKGAKGKFLVHHPEFHRREKEFAEYLLAKRWEKENSHLFFKQKES